jgi:hypothetical protein
LKINPYKSIYRTKLYPGKPFIFRKLPLMSPIEI